MKETKFIDLHAHTLFSDGVLLPSELIYRAKFNGYDVLAITDHGDISTVDFVIPRIKKVCQELSKHYKITVLPGIELTYVPPALIKAMVKKCRKLGAKIVVVHGETTAENVPPGTNRAAVLSGADILAHPGFISDEEAKLAARNGVLLELTTRSGHNRTNGHVAKLALRHGAKLVLNTDTHGPDDLMDMKKIKNVIDKSGLKISDYETILKNAASLARLRSR
jgi:histidinol phosphatase-like PHP family hydrolase